MQILRNQSLKQMECKFKTRIQDQTFLRFLLIKGFCNGSVNYKKNMLIRMKEKPYPILTVKLIFIADGI